MVDENSLNTEPQWSLMPYLPLAYDSNPRFQFPFNPPIAPVAWAPMPPALPSLHLKVFRICSIIWVVVLWFDYFFVFFRLVISVHLYGIFSLDILTHTCISVYLYTCIHSYTLAYTHAHLYTFIYTHIHLYTLLNTCIQSYTLILMFAKRWSQTIYTHIHSTHWFSHIQILLYTKIHMSFLFTCYQFANVYIFYTSIQNRSTSKPHPRIYAGVYTCTLRIAYTLTHTHAKA